MKNATDYEKVFHEAASYINANPGNFFKSEPDYTAADFARYVWNIFLNWAWGW